VLITVLATMADVFISYARSDESHAIRVVDELRSLGYTVWRDDELPAHRDYAEVIEERLRSAGAVVVLWSVAAAKSQWVRAEADVGRNAGQLVQATLDKTIPPLPFNQIQCADLSDWAAEGQHTGWSKLLSSVQVLVGSEPAPRNGDLKPRRRKLSVCVLPFANMSGDAEQEYFSDGISEDITTDLSKVSALAVTARNTAFTFKGQATNVCEVAEKLGVGHVLEGSVRKAGGRVRISAQLIDGLTGDHVWAERYDRELTDIFAIQDEISKAIVEALRVKLLPEEKKAIEQRGTTSADAYNLYLLARGYWITGNWGDTRQLELVIRVCRKAVDLDPNYARAWGLMALVQCILHFTFAGSDDSGTEAAERALAIDPAIAEAYCVQARHAYEQGKFAEADQLLNRALELEPESWEVNRETARIFYFERRFDEAVIHYERAVSLDETDYHSWNMLCSAYGALGNSGGANRAAQMAVAGAESALAHDPTNGAALGTAVTGLAVMGERERALDWIQRALLVAPENILARYNIACIMALKLDDPDGALDLLEPIVGDLSQSGLKAFVADPDFAALQGNPRYEKLLARASRKLSEK
jgi:adenylate cyclase